MPGASGGNEAAWDPPEANDMLKEGTRILVTGGAGFVGGKVTRALAELGCNVRVLDDLSTGKRERLAGLKLELLHGDVRNPNAVARAAHGAEAIVHLATCAGSEPTRAQEVNLGGTLHVLDAARKAERRTQPRVILCGSGSVYGRQSAFVLHEELYPHPATPDAVMALCAEEYGRVYRETWNVPVVLLRIFRVFGADEVAERSNAGVVARFISAAQQGTSPVIFGDGQQTRDLVYVDNVVSAILQSLRVDIPEGPLNIASGEAVSINFLWTQVLELSGKRRLAIEPTYMPPPGWEPRQGRPQIARACQALGWAPSVRLREGLQRTIQHTITTRKVDPNSWFTPKKTPPKARRSATPPPPPLRVPPPAPASAATPQPERLPSPPVCTSELDIEWAPVPTMPGPFRS